MTGSDICNPRYFAPFVLDCDIEADWGMYFLPACLRYRYDELVASMALVRALLVPISPKHGREVARMCDDNAEAISRVFSGRRPLP